MHTSHTSPAATALFATLADPMRRSLLDALRHGELPVTALCDRVSLHQSGVSRHLGILHDAGFVQVRPDGPRRLYSLRPEPFRELDRWIAQYRDLWEARLDRFAAALADHQKRKAKAKTKTGANPTTKTAAKRRPQ